MTLSADAASPSSDPFVTDREQWVRAAAQALVRDMRPDADPHAVVARLRSTTEDGIEIAPLYTADDAMWVEAAGFPGFGPLVRGRTPSGNRVEGWDVRQPVDASDARFAAVDELERGATSLWLDVRGLDTIDTAGLAVALEGVLLDLTSITLRAGDRWQAAAEAMLGLWTDQGVGGNDARGCLGADPIGDHASSGGPIPAELEADLVAVAAWGSRIASSHPEVRVVTVDATRFHDAGAPDGHELGLCIAAGVEYLRAYEAAGASIEAAMRQMELRLAASADQFSTIAKFRAVRTLWFRVAEVAGFPDAARSTSVHAVTSAAMTSRYDPWVNVLRATTACFAAGIGGADAITVGSYDAVADPAGTELGRRIARNTQSILLHESHLHNVIDPAGGSWYVEHLTDQLAACAWAHFQRIEAAGGLRAAVASGVVADEIEAAWQQRRRRIVTRRDPLTGVSEFPNIGEIVAPDASASGGAKAAAGAVSSPTALAFHRLAEPFEVLRRRVDAHSGAGGSRPTVYLANLGPATAHTARASFAKNLFEVAGIVTVNGSGSLDPVVVGEQFAASGARVACICSSDRVYADLAVAAADRLRASGATTIYLAGRPAALAESLTAAGIDVFLAAGDDVESVLVDLLRRLEVP